ncbi:unnamed protein product [Heligmosomoides polygyrus]|uniref:Spherulation-specific family 4 n=1 Tax=Heligmosomoides polygyrus TaxID=6339 RepID=A0A183GIP3_HELPZ|nr:unnamed protein product [Heligmosomoides polygyrus]
MTLLAVLGTLAAIGIIIEGKPAVILPQFALALDFDGLAGEQSLQCLKDSDFKTIFLEAYDIHHGNGQLHKNVVGNAHRADEAGLDVEIFMTPLTQSEKRGDKQFEELYDGLIKGGVYIQTIWIKVANRDYWDKDQRKNIALINEIALAAKKHRVSVGIYTNNDDWDAITHGANTDNAELWNIYRLSWSTEKPKKTVIRPIGPAPFISSGPTNVTVNQLVQKQ